MKKRITALMLGVVMCLSLLCAPAAAATAGTGSLTASYSNGVVTVSASGLDATTGHSMLVVSNSNNVIAMKGLSNVTGSLSSTTIETGTLANGSYTVVLYEDSTGNPVTKTFQVTSNTPEPGPSPDPSPSPEPSPDPTASPSPSPDGGGSGGGGGGGGGGSSATNSPKIEKNTGGTVKVSSDGKTVTITPKDGYRIKDVIINGQSVGAVTKYVFDKASSKNTVEVNFEKISDTDTTDTPSTSSFNDVTGHWAANAINFVVNEGLFNGTSSTTFSPNAPMTRSMLATVLYRLAGEPRVSGASSFADVPVGQWYSNAVAWAAQNGIVTGTGTGFAPNGNITREQLATMLYRYCAFVKGNTSASKPLSFPDASKVSNWATEAMQWAVGAGIINGTDTGALNPGGYATRAEVATMLMRFVNFLG